MSSNIVISVNPSSPSKDVSLLNNANKLQILDVAFGNPNLLFLNRAESGLFYPLSNPSGFLTTAQAGGIQSVNVTGSHISGVVTFIGVGLSVYQSGQSIIFSGNSGVIQNVANVVFATGDQSISGNKNFLNTVNISGDVSVTGLLRVDNIVAVSDSDIRVDTFNRQLLDNQPFPSVDWGQYLLLFNGNTSLDWQNQILSGTWNIQNLNVNGIPVNKNVIFVTGNQVISGNKSFSSSIIVTGNVTATSNVSAGNYQNSAGANIIGANSRVLLDSGLAISVDWQNRILSGTWNAQNLLISGQSITASGYITTGQTGLFYPNSNPSGYATGVSAAFLLSKSQFLTSGTLSVVSINALRNIPVASLATNTIAAVASYYGEFSSDPILGPLDNEGGGLFVWRPGISGIDDGGRFIQPSGGPATGVWVRIINGMPNVRMWGARGYNSGIYNLPTDFDDTSYIQAALNACNLSWCVSMRIPQGVFYVSSPLVTNECNCVQGDNGHTIIRTFNNYSGDIFRTKHGDWAVKKMFSADPNNPFYAAGFFDANIRFANLTILLPPGASGNGITFSQPGEQSIVDCVAIHSGNIGVRIFGAAAPGLTFFSPQLEEQAEAAIKIEPLMLDSGSSYVIPGGEYVIDRISSDVHGYGPWTGYNSLIKVVSGAASLYINNPKIEASYGSGMINYQKHPDFTNASYIHFRGGNIGGNASVSNPFIILRGATTTGGNVSYSTPFVTLENIYQFGLTELIRDYNVPINRASGIPYILYPNFDGGTNFTEVSQPLQYFAVEGSHGTVGVDMFSGAFRRIQREGKAIYKFQPTQTGWYRIATNIQLNMAGGRFSISEEPGNQYTYLKFDTFLNIHTGTLTVVNQYPSIYGSRISGVRAGWSNGNYAFIDIAVVAPYTGVFNRYENYLLVEHQEDGLNAWPNESQLIDPYLITGFPLGTVYMQQSAF